MNDSDVEALMGAYALDAVEPDEALAVEQHLATCPRCRAEVSAHREVAAMLGNVGGEAPDGLWDRIAREIDVEFAAAPLLDLAGARAVRGSSGSERLGRANGPLGARRRRVHPLAWSLGTVAAALAVVVGLLSAKVGTLDNQVRTISSAVRTGGIAQQAALAAADPRHHSVELSSAVGASVAVLVVLPDGQAYWITQGTLRALPGNQTYQLWALVDGRKISIGLLGGSPKDVPVVVTRNMTRFMVTAEPLGGTVQPTTPIVVQGATAV
jgi:anti-sigma factor RsiW